jgi:hypothetical protein
VITDPRPDRGLSEASEGGFLDPLSFVALGNEHVAKGICRDVVCTVELAGPVTAGAELTDNLERLKTDDPRSVP